MGAQRGWRSIFVGYLVVVSQLVDYPFGFWVFVASAVTYGALAGTVSREVLQCRGRVSEKGSRL